MHKLPRLRRRGVGLGSSWDFKRWLANCQHEKAQAPEVLRKSKSNSLDLTWLDPCIRLPDSKARLHSNKPGWAWVRIFNLQNSERNHHQFSSFTATPYSFMSSWFAVGLTLLSVHPSVVHHITKCPVLETKLRILKKHFTMHSCRCMPS